MRKHNVKFARRFSRFITDRSNLPQSSAHAMVNDKQVQLFANRTLAALLYRSGAAAVQGVL